MEADFHDFELYLQRTDQHEEECDALDWAKRHAFGDGDGFPESLDEAVAFAQLFADRISMLRLRQYHEWLDSMR